MSKVFFTADTHFGSERTLTLSRRPFKTVEEMDETLIDNWNSVVGKDDIVWHLGDFGNYEVVKRLNGKINLIWGNYELNEFIKKYNIMESIKQDPYYQIKMLPAIESNKHLRDKILWEYMTPYSLHDYMRDEPSWVDNRPDSRWDYISPDSRYSIYQDKIHEFSMFLYSYGFHHVYNFNGTSTIMEVGLFSFDELKKYKDDEEFIKDQTDENGNIIDLDLWLHMIHEPIMHVRVDEREDLFDEMCLFGHIHGRQLIKPYGLDVGVDGHHFYPIDTETVLFYRNAIVNHYDENVFLQ
jgi:calcineurin-like phosphoesterase family protein